MRIKNQVVQWIKRHPAVDGILWRVRHPLGGEPISLKLLRGVAPREGFVFMLKPLKPRKHIQVIQERFKDTPLVGVEVGVFRGYNSQELMRHLNVSKLYLIDSYEDNPKAVEYFTKERLVNARNDAKARMKEFGDKIVWIHKMSDEAFGDIKEKVDFVYVDADHDYEPVKKDIDNSYAILKEGGILAGHDLTYPGVFRAYSEFLLQHQMSANIDATICPPGEHWSADWWIIKE